MRCGNAKVPEPGGGQWRYIEEPDHKIVHSILAGFGAGGIDWIGNRQTILYSLLYSCNSGVRAQARYLASRGQMPHRILCPANKLFPASPSGSMIMCCTFRLLAQATAL